MKHRRILYGYKIQGNSLGKNMISTELYHMALGLLSHLDFMIFIEMIVKEATKLLKTQHGYYNLVEVESGQMIRKVGLGLHQSDVDHVMSLKQGLIRETIETGEITISNKDCDFNRRLSTPYFDQVRTEVQIPIKIKSKILGVLGLSFVESNRTFGKMEMAILQQFAVIASIGISNATLYSAAQREKKKTKILEANYQAIFSSVNDGIIIYDVETLAVIDANEKACTLFGFSKADMLRMKLQDLGTGEFPYTLKESLPWLQKALHGETPLYDWKIKNMQGRYIDLEVSLKYVKLGGKCRILSVVRDISEREFAKEQIYRLANFDELTKLPNRTLFNDRLHIALAHAKRNGEKLAILFFDLDRFKTINDSLGHNIGDIILQEVAERLKLCIRDEDTLCRMGADEFAIILTDIASSSNMNKIVSRMATTLSMPYIIGEVELRITSSIGITFYPDNGHTPEILIKHAELAMYYAKENGRNNYQFFTESLNDVATERLSLENSIRLGIERNEFELYYQPQVNIRTNKLIGVEALIRWNHPERGLTSPAQFISVAEETGLIIPIGNWVLHEACRQHLSWIDFGLPAIQIAVNVSAIQFQEKQFLSNLQEIIKNYNINPTYLELELTEGTIMKDVHRVIKELHFIKGLGVKLSIDDFGTGYSSLQYLSQIPIDKLKIDQSFIQAMTVDPSSLAIVETIISLAEKLHIKVIAEGVETKEGISKILNCGCDEVQGYYFSKPLPAHKFVEWYYDR